LDTTEDFKNDEQKIAQMIMQLRDFINNWKNELIEWRLKWLHVFYIYGRTFLNIPLIIMDIFGGKTEINFYFIYHN
jgi:hypothetical protein